MRRHTGITAYLWVCTSLTVAIPGDTLGNTVTTKFRSFANLMKDPSDPANVMTFFGTRSAIECSVTCLNQAICISFNVCPETFHGYPIRCELFKTRAVRANLKPSMCNYCERESPCQNGGEYLDNEGRCKCVGSYAGLTCHRYMRDCSEGYRDRKNSWGYYMIQPKDSPEPFEVSCNHYNSGGTTGIMRRFIGLTTDFFATWQAYKKGMGKHWIGNEYLHQITRQGVYKLYVGIMLSGENNFNYVYYDQISVGNESERYTLHLGTYRPGKFDGDSLTPPSDPERNINGKSFSTFDNDVSNDCPTTLQAGWWFAENCTAANLNGPMDYPNFPRANWYYPFGDAELINLVMKIKAISYYSDMP